MYSWQHLTNCSKCWRGFQTRSMNNAGLKRGNAANNMFLLNMFTFIDSTQPSTTLASLPYNMDNHFVFVHQEGPKLRRAQKTMVRSTAMYVTRVRKRRTAEGKAQRDKPVGEIPLGCNPPSPGDRTRVRKRMEYAPITDLLPPALLRELGQPPQDLQAITSVKGKFHQDYIQRAENCRCHSFPLVFLTRSTGFVHCHGPSTELTIVVSPYIRRRRD
jgi:hypothetical protein